MSKEKKFKLIKHEDRDYGYIVDENEVYVQVHKHTILYIESLQQQLDQAKLELLKEAEENTKLRCLALHLMKEFLSLKSKSLWAFLDSPVGRTMLSADEYERLRDKAWRICNHITHYRKAYRKLKAELKETTK